MGCRFSCCLPRGDYINRAYRAECFGTALHKQASATCQTKTYRMYVTASHSNKMHFNTNTQVLPHIPWECSWNNCSITSNEKRSRRKDILKSDCQTKAFGSMECRKATRKVRKTRMKKILQKEDKVFALCSITAWSPSKALQNRVINSMAD